MVAGAGVAMARCCLTSSSLNMTLSSFLAARACLCTPGRQHSQTAHWDAADSDLEENLGYRVIPGWASRGTTGCCWTLVSTPVRL